MYFPISAWLSMFQLCVLWLECVIHAYIKENYSLGWIHNDIAIKFYGSNRDYYVFWSHAVLISLRYGMNILFPFDNHKGLDSGWQITQTFMLH